jgi:hypothetical protein
VLVLVRAGLRAGGFDFGLRELARREADGGYH